MVDKGLYQATVDEVNNKVNDCNGLKGRVQDACETLVVALGAAGGIGFGLPGILLGGLTAEWVWKKRDEIFRKLDEVLNKLKEVVEGILAPFTFIDLADGWRTGVQKHIKDAADSVNQDTQLGGYWRGVAAGRYNVARGKQISAMSGVTKMDTEIADKLDKLADSGWDFYKSVVKSLTDFLTGIGTAIGKIAAVITAPWGISDTIDLCGKAVKTMVDLMTAEVSQLRDQYKTKLALESLPEVTEGFSKNNPGGNSAWPTAGP